LLTSSRIWKRMKEVDVISSHNFLIQFIYGVPLNLFICLFVLSGDIIIFPLYYYSYYYCYCCHYHHHHDVRPINDLFLSHDYVHPVVSLMVVQVFFFFSFFSSSSSSLSYANKWPVPVSRLCPSRSCYGYLMSSILVTWFNHFRLCCAKLFFYWLCFKFFWNAFHFFCGPINCVLLCCVSWISSLLSSVFLYPSVSISTFHSHIKGIEWLKYHVLSIKIIFGLNLVWKHCSQFPKFVKKIFFIKLCPLRMIFRLNYF
jgi:hypothetical protein